VAGYQGYFVNSNVVVAFNTFSNVYYAVMVEGAGQNLVEDVLVSSNTALGVHDFASGYGWSTNVIFLGNTGDTSTAHIDSSQLQGQWYFDDLSDHIVPLFISDPYGETNTITYASGARDKLWAGRTNSIFVIDDTHPAQIPLGAALQITNTGNYSVPVYASASMSGTPMFLPVGNVVTYLWTNGVWMSLSANGPAPPTNMHVIVPGP
jgi:hypothetical protein